MAKREGRIAPINKSFPHHGSYPTLESSLAENGFPATFPNTRKIITPYKEPNGKYRTGLDENASYLNNMSKEDREIEIKRIRSDKERLEKALGLDLSKVNLDSRSDFYNYASKLPEGQKVSPVSLSNTDVVFNLEDPFAEVQFNWVRRHPSIAPNLEAYERGRAGDVKYYVLDVESENEVAFDRKKQINKAITSLETLSPTRLRQIARLMSLPISDDDSEKTVYNQIDTVLKKTDFKSGRYSGMSPVRVFNDLVSSSPALITIKDLITQAINHNIYRQKDDVLYEGNVKVADSFEDLAVILSDKQHADELLALKNKLKIKITEDL